MFFLPKFIATTRLVLFVPFEQIEQMEKLFQEAKDESLNEEFYQKLAKKLK